MTITVAGVNETISNLNRINRELSNIKSMATVAALVAGDAQKNAPVDAGLLRASITPSVESHGNKIVGVVGSNAAYAPFMELGARPHWPPLAALETWARRHGITAYLVARAIARRGLRARRFLERALDDNTSRIDRILNDDVKRIIK